MPIYSYVCVKCSTQFDKLISQGRRDDPQPCPKCSETSERQVTAPGGFDLKGNGWYSKGNY